MNGTQIRELSGLTRRLQQPLTLEQMLQAIADTAARVLGVERASVRLLDPTGQKLIATVRAGEPLHENALGEFELGQGLVGWVARQLEPLRLGDAEKDPRFLKRPDQKAAIGSFLGVPLVSGRVCVGVLSAVHPELGHFSDEDQDVLELLAGICAPQVELARLARLSQVDPLTGALNRRGLDLVLPEGLPRANDGEPVSVIMVDLDDFKQVNDRYGHAVGDEALRRVALVLSGLLRVGDGVIRYGGEEFLLVLPGLEMARAIRVAERARAGVEAATLTVGASSIRLTVSIGVAAHRGGEKRDDVIRRADEAMYAAKRAGKNRVEAGR
ncbi:MAG: sensor domain-containing diguanylate cyclase [Deltaproteobacteria bacterium]|nr:sensor domain-containing diguanylate cyclase [Deltaproteobacteria bacterium]